jgi:cytochrome c
LMTTPSRSFNMVGDRAHIGFKNIDLTGIAQIEFLAQAQPRSGASGGVIEVHIDSPDGKLIGKSQMIAPKDVSYRDAMAKLRAADGNKKAAPTQASEIDFDALRRIMCTSVNAKLEEAGGLHDVYFVFRNEKAEEKQIIVQMVQINFQNGKENNSL